MGISIKPHALIIFLSAILLSSFFVLLQIDKNEARALIDFEGGGELTEAEKMTLFGLEQKLEILDSKTKVPLPTELIQTVISHKNPDVRLTEIVYDKLDSGGAVRTFGTAATRDALLLYLASLEQEPSFSEVSSPISNLSASVDINFSVSIDIQEDEE